MPRASGSVRAPLGSISHEKTVGAGTTMKSPLDLRGRARADDGITGRPCQGAQPSPGAEGPLAGQGDCAVVRVGQEAPREPRGQGGPRAARTAVSRARGWCGGGRTTGLAGRGGRVKCDVQVVQVVQVVQLHALRAEPDATAPPPPTHCVRFCDAGKRWGPSKRWADPS